jgi:hypothetical protein
MYLLYVIYVSQFIQLKEMMNNEHRWNECSTGIHFFITEQEAINY